MKWLIALVLIVGLSEKANAQKPEGQGYGIGMNSCAQFARDYSAQPQIAENLYFAWAEGFMSGMNLAATMRYQQARHLASLNPDSDKLEIRMHCNAHPLDPYYSALTQIYLRLPQLP